MEVTELTKMIKNDYPRVWEEMKNSLAFYQTTKNNEDEIYEKLDGINLRFDVNGTIDIDIEIGEYYHFTTIIFPMLYGLLEDFFEENGIFISLKLCWNFDNKSRWEMFLTNKDSEFLLIDGINAGGNYLLKQEAKQQAILKACEILEKRL